jgi:hypothetical protein
MPCGTCSHGPDSGHLAIILCTNNPNAKPSFVANVEFIGFALYAKSSEMPGWTRPLRGGNTQNSVYSCNCLIPGSYNQKEYTMTPAEVKRFEILYDRHLKLLKLQGKSEKTRDAYSRAVRRIVKHFDCCPDKLDGPAAGGLFCPPC